MTIRGTLTILLLVVVLFFASPAFAANLERAVSPSGHASITLTDERTGCEWNDAAKRAVYEGPSGSVGGCYVKVDGTVYVIFENGQMLQLPESIFKAVPNV
jgi:hypothetical protein